MTCTTGARLASRAPPSAATIRANGRSWCSYAPTMASRTRPRNSVNGGSPEASQRMGSVLTRKPISGVSAARRRLALVVPTTRSSCPV